MNEEFKRYRWWIVGLVTLGGFFGNETASFIARVAAAMMNPYIPAS